MFRLDEFFRYDYKIGRKDIESGLFAPNRLPHLATAGALLVLVEQKATGRRGVRWHQGVVAHLVPNIVVFPDAIGPAQLKLEDLLGGCLTQRISKSVLTLSKLLALNCMLVIS